MDVVFSRRECLLKEYTGISARFLSRSEHWAKTRGPRSYLVLEREVLQHTQL